MAHSDWHHISTYIGRPDIESALKQFIKKAASSLATITKDRKMAHVPSEGRGIFSPNSHKKHPKAPDWKGQLMINGEIVKFSGWIKKSAYGEFLSLAVDNWKPNNAAQEQQQQYPKEVTPTYDGDVPF